MNARAGAGIRSGARRPGGSDVRTGGQAVLHRDEARGEVGKGLAVQLALNGIGNRPAFEARPRARSSRVVKMIAFTVRGLGNASLIALGLTGCTAGPPDLSSRPHRAEPARANLPRRSPAPLVIGGRVTATLPGDATRHLAARGVPGATVSLLAGESEIAET